MPVGRTLNSWNNNFPRTAPRCEVAPLSNLLKATSLQVRGALANNGKDPASEQTSPPTIQPRAEDKYYGIAPTVDRPPGRPNTYHHNKTVHEVAGGSNPAGRDQQVELDRSPSYPATNQSATNQPTNHPGVLPDAVPPGSALPSAAPFYSGSSVAKAAPM